MKISYENTDEDSVAWNYVRLAKTVTGRKAQKNLRIVLTLCQALIGVIGYLVFCSLVGLRIEPVILLLLGTLAGALGYGIQLLQFRHNVRRQTKTLKKNGIFAQFSGPKEVTISPEGIVTSWPEGTFLRRWNSISRVEDAEDHVLFIYGDADFSIVPKRAFRDAAHQQEFVAAIERYKAGAGAVATNHAPSVNAAGAAPWWRNRNAVDTAEENPLQQRRP
jgi:hypothetical protein